LVTHFLGVVVAFREAVLEALELDYQDMRALNNTRKSDRFRLPGHSEVARLVSVGREESGQRVIETRVLVDFQRECFEDLEALAR
jgi:hypothetical protein